MTAFNRNENPWGTNYGGDSLATTELSAVEVNRHQRGAYSWSSTRPILLLTRPYWRFVAWRRHGRVSAP